MECYYLFDWMILGTAITKMKASDWLVVDGLSLLSKTRKGEKRKYREIKNYQEVWEA